MIILLGGSGYVGQAFQRLLNGLNVPFHNLARKELDYSETHRLADFLAETGASFVINAAGYTGKPNVDACELHQAACLFGNAVLPGRIREACEKAGTPWGHISSGCIYSGERPGGGGFREDDVPNFSSARTIAASTAAPRRWGEEVLSGAQQCFVWRLRIPFNEAESPRNYLTKLMRYARLLEADNSPFQPARRVRARVFRVLGEEVTFRHV